MSVLVTSAEIETVAATVEPVEQAEGEPALPCVPRSAFVDARRTST
jgi:hypothetical protein